MRVRPGASDRRRRRAAWACNAAPGRPTADSEVMAPNKVVNFDVLYASNCAGCHGANGGGGLALSLADPVYLAIADDPTIRRVIAEGVPGTAMLPPFAASSGGMLTAEQIDAIVHGIRTRWARRGRARRDGKRRPMPRRLPVTRSAAPTCTRASARHVTAPTDTEARRPARSSTVPISRS